MINPVFYKHTTDGDWHNYVIIHELVQALNFALENECYDFFHNGVKYNVDDFNYGGCISEFYLVDKTTKEEIEYELNRLYEIEMLYNEIDWRE